MEEALAPPLAYSLGEAWAGIRPALSLPGSGWRQLAGLLEPLLG